MSTKTTFKRIALVTVAALGFGLLSSVAPASATAGGASVSTSSLTVVGGTTGTGGSGLFYVDVTNSAGAAAALTAAESLTVTVTGKPAYKADGTTAATLNDVTVQAVATTDGGATFAAVGNATAGGIQVPNAAGTYESNNWTYDATDAPTGTASRYWFAVYPTDTSPVDAGAYTLRVRLTDSTLFIRDSSLSVKFVTSAADSGAAIALSSAGGLYTGEALSYTSTNKLQATLTDAAGGRLVKAAATTASLASRAPQLSAAIVTTSSGVAASDVLSIDDNGVAATDHVASTTTQIETFNTYSKAGDGLYGITAAATTGIVSTASVLKSLRVRYGSLEKLLAVTIYGATSAIDAKTDLTLTATGVLAADQLIKSDVATTTAYTLPTSTTSAKLRINVDNASNVAVADQPMTVKTTWSGNYATASVSPATTTTTVSNTDASGNIDLTITNSAPLAGAVATVTITGYGYTAGTSRGTTAGSTIVTLTWAAAAATTITVVDPTPSVKVKTGTTNVLTVRVKDQFGNVMAGESLQPSLSSDSSNYSSTTTYGAITTGSAGTATFSLTDATAAAGSDVVSFASISNSAATAGTFTLTYVTTLPVAASVSAYYNNTFVTTASTLVPSTGIYGDTGTGTKLAIVNGRNISKDLSAFADGVDDDMVSIRIKAVTSTGASATGAALTLTAPTGGWVLDGSGLPAASRTVAVGSDSYAAFQILATVAGDLTFTATTGTLSTTVTLHVAVPTAAAGRTVAISGASTGTAFSDGVPMTVTVKDRYGNAVTGVTLTLSATGAGSFAGGATTQSFTTDSTGTYTFQAKSYDAAGGAATYKASVGNATDSASIAGYSAGVAVDSTLAAGISSATATVTFAGGTDPAVTAGDAAAEATDAANAATDAANAAAEAADAATAAAQDAADAVAALSAQVATLISGLKAQLTALTNLVIKIQKKVKA